MAQSRLLNAPNHFESKGAPITLPSFRLSEELPIPDTSLGLSIVHKGSLSASELIKFLSNRDKYVLKKTQAGYLFGTRRRGIFLACPEWRVISTLRKGKYLRELEEGYSDDELTRQRSLDPFGENGKDKGEKN